MDADAFENLDALFVALGDQSVDANGIARAEHGKLVPLLCTLNGLDGWDAVAHDVAYPSLVCPLRSPARPRSRIVSAGGREESSIPALVASV